MFDGKVVPFHVVNLDFLQLPFLSVKAYFHYVLAVDLRAADNLKRCHILATLKREGCEVRKVDERQSAEGGREMACVQAPSLRNENTRYRGVTVVDVFDYLRVDRLF